MNFFKRTYLICAMLLLFVASSSAQTGYFGKRFIFSAEVGYNWNIYDNQKASKTLFAFVAQYGGGISFIADKKSQINMLCSFYSMNDLYDFHDTILHKTSGYFSDQLSGTQIQLTYRFYLNKLFKVRLGSIAPDGKFIEIGPALSLINYTPGEKSYFDFHYGYYHTPTIYPASNRRFLGLAVGAGAQHVYWDHLVASSGMMFMIPITEIGKEENVPKDMDFLHQLRLRDVVRVRLSLGYIF